MVALAAKTSSIVFTPCPPDEHVLGEALWLALFSTFCSYLHVIFTETYENAFKFLQTSLELLLPSTKEQFCFLTAPRISQKALISPHL